MTKHDKKAEPQNLLKRRSGWKPLAGLCAGFDNPVSGREQAARRYQ